VLDAVDKVAAIRTESLALRLRSLEYLADTLLRLEGFQVIVAQVQLVGRLAAGFALQIAALLDFGLLVLDDRLHLVLEGLLQQDIVPIQIQGLVQAAHEALKRFIVLEIEKGHLGVAIEVQVAQIVDITHGLNWRWSHVVFVVVVTVDQAHVKELQLRHRDLGFSHTGSQHILAELGLCSVWGIWNQGSGHRQVQRDGQRSGLQIYYFSIVKFLIF